MKEKKPGKDQSLKMKDMSSGEEIKSGYKATKPQIDGFKGKPAKVNKQNEYVCEDADQAEYYKNKGYKTRMKDNG